MANDGTVYLQVFNVEHGACALVTCANNARIMIDCGHNATSGWRPGSYLRSIGVSYLEKLIITNYDEDHVSGITDLFANVSVGTIARNTKVTPADIRKLKSEDGMGPGIDHLIWQVENSFSAPGLSFGQPQQFTGVTVNYFDNSPVYHDDENNLSLVTKITCNGANVLFTGDMELEGWKTLLATDPNFRAALLHMDIFVASHHGRESGKCDDLFPLMGPNGPRFVVISDKAKGFQSQETSGYYHSKSSGGTFRNQNPRHVLTTRSDGDITFAFSTGGGYSCY